MPIACPNCDARTDSDDKFCPSCGTALAASCHNCGASVHAGDSFCQSCGEPIGQASGSGADSEATQGDGAWSLGREVLATHIHGDELESGWFSSTSVAVEQGTRALIFENGQLVESVGPGNYTVSSLKDRINDRLSSVSSLLGGSDRRVSMVLVRDTRVATNMHFGELRTAGDFDVDIDLEVVLSVEDPELFFAEMVSGRDRVTIDTITGELQGAVRNVLEETIQRHDHDELYGNPDLLEEMEQDVEHRCRQILEANGLRLDGIRSFDYHGDLDDVRETRREGKKEVLETKAELETTEELTELGQQEREVEAADRIHEVDTQQDVAEVEHEAAMQSGERGHEREMQGLEHEKEQVDVEQDIEMQEVEHEIEKEDKQWEQDKKEMGDLMDLQDKKNRQEIDREREQLQNREDVDLSTLASLDDTPDDITELAKMEMAGDLSAEQLDSLGAQQSDELAKARQEAQKAEAERKRVEDQKEMREDMKEMFEQSTDRIQETADSAMDNMGETAASAAEDTSDNVIVSGNDGGGGGDTTIVQGGKGGGDSGDGGPERLIVCSECGEEHEYGTAFCTNCGFEFG